MDRRHRGVSARQTKRLEVLSPDSRNEEAFWKYKSKASVHSVYKYKICTEIDLRDSVLFVNSDGETSRLGIADGIEIPVNPFFS